MTPPTNANSALTPVDSAPTVDGERAAAAPTLAALPPVASIDEHAQRWLATQCSMMTGVSHALVLRRESRTEDAPVDQLVASWPERAAAIQPTLMNVALKVLKTCEFVIESCVRGDHGDHARCIVAAPILKRRNECAVVALILPAAIRRQQQALVQLLKWGADWYGLLQRDQSEVVPKGRLVDVVEMLASSLEHSEFQAAATTAVTELAARLGCSRASLGLLDGEHVTVHAVSNTSSVDARSNLIRDIGRAMDEVVDQDATIAFPPVSNNAPHVSFAQEVLVRRNEGGAVCSVPLYDGDQVIGALTLENDRTQSFRAQIIETCEVFGALLGPVVELKFEKERSLARKVLSAGHDFFSRLFGRRHFALKAYALALAGLVLVLSLATGQYRVTAQAALEGSQRRVITAPREGFVASASLRAGDIVALGDVLATLDDRELRLERTKLDSQREQLEKEYRAAQSAHDRSTAAIVGARRAQIDAQITLIEQQLKRSQLTAPISGIVISGDLSQSLGSPVEHGQTLFEIAPLDGYRVVLEVDERDIGEVRVAQQGHITLTGLPGDALPFSVTRIVPISSQRDGRNYFEVEATLDDDAPLVRPGMGGVAKVDIEQRKLIWVWTHTMSDWLRLKLWTWSS
ncbi:MAG: HlyD family efflux transporter periplasmic adaptor subunit [Gammaproteobacteria bacterium]